MAFRVVKIEVWVPLGSLKGAKNGEIVSNLKNLKQLQLLEFSANVLFKLGTLISPDGHLNEDSCERIKAHMPLVIYFVIIYLLFMIYSQTYY